MSIKKVCNYCQCEFDAHSNRDQYCDRVCAGFGRRKHKTIGQKKLEKRLYDMQYRSKNKEMLKAKKHAYFKKVYDPVKAAEIRRTEEYREYRRQYMSCYMTENRIEDKRIYDRNRRSTIKYGEYAECHILLMDLENEVKKHITKYEARLQNGILNKAQQRGRNGTIKRSYS